MGWTPPSPGRLPLSNSRPAPSFGTFIGVFRPTVLTILGALLVLRTGWVVGNVGFGGFLLVLAAMYLVTVPTALSMASMTSNIRIGQGGVFSIISQSMGLEAGGAIGVPFYLAQSLGAALYIYAFTEAWAFLFPDHGSGWVALTVFSVCASLVLLGARRAFRAQGVVMLGSLAALASMAAGLGGAGGGHVIELAAPAGSTSFSGVFAVFFPAATGILVGASMSGSLKNPRVSIPRGTLAAVAVSAGTYLAAGIWFALVASGEELRADTAIAFTKARFPKVVVIGVLASTFNAAISSMVAAPRVLQALAEYGVVPFDRELARVSRGGEPRTAAAVTIVLVAVGLSAGSLDAIAPLLTVFFLITYASLNLVVLVEQWLGLPSFRPTFRVPLLAPAIGATASVVAILATSPVFGWMALCLVLGLYAWLVRRRLPNSFETARSGLLVSIAAWAARKIGELPASTERSWKPDLLVPVVEAEELAGAYLLLRAAAGAKGSVHIVGIETGAEATLDIDELTRLSGDLLADGVNSKATSTSADSFGEAVSFTMSVLMGAFLPPNILFLTADPAREEEITGIVASAREHRFGVVLRSPHPVAALGQERMINVWVRDQTPNWQLSLKMASIDLSLLLALQIREAWSGRIRLVSIVGSESSVEGARAFLEDLWVQARVPGEPMVHVESGDFRSLVASSPRADLNVMGLANEVDFSSQSAIVAATGSTCLFVQASGRESALA